MDGGVFVLERGVRGLNAAILCDTPSAKMNCSRSSMLVRPLAACGRRPVCGIVTGSGLEWVKNRLVTGWIKKKHQSVKKMGTCKGSEEKKKKQQRKSEHVKQKQNEHIVLIIKSNSNVSVQLG